MARVYLDRALLDAPPAGDPAEDLRHLADAGFALVVLDDPRSGGNQPRASDPGGAMHVGDLRLGRARAVDPRARGDWLLTTDPGRCGRARQSVCRTILVGPPVGGDRPAVSRCDAVVRDLRSAVLEILAADAMADLA